MTGGICLLTEILEGADAGILERGGGGGGAPPSHVNTVRKKNEKVFWRRRCAKNENQSANKHFPGIWDQNPGFIVG